MAEDLQSGEITTLLVVCLALGRASRGSHALGFGSFPPKLTPQTLDLGPQGVDVLLMFVRRRDVETVRRR